MKAAVVTRYGGPEVFEIREMPLPQPGPGQVLIEVAYAGLNYADLTARQGTYMARPVPFVPGYEVSGTVQALGEGVEGLSVGQRVAALTVHSGYAELVLAQAALTFPLDIVAKNVDFAQAGAFPAVAITAYDLLTRAAHLSQGESVLMHAASGGVGVAAGQIAQALGAGLVLGTTSSQDKADYALSYGYDQVFPLEGFENKVMEATNGQGVDIALDARGEPTRSQNLALLATFGRLVVFGNASGNPEKPISPTELLRGNKAIVGYSITALSQTAPHLVAETAQKVLGLMSKGGLKMAISATFPLEQIAEAHRHMESGAHLGKLMLKVK